MGWERGGYVSRQHLMADNIDFVDYFKSGSYYKGMFAYSCTVSKKYYMTKEKENYTEIVRLIDGKVLIRAWENGKIEEFIPTALTKSQVEKYKNSSYDELLQGIK